MLEAIPDMVHSPLRIARPAIREGWREGKAAHRHRPLPRSVLGRSAGRGRRRTRAGARAYSAHTAILGGSYGWSSAGRVHHARTLVRRFLFLGGGCVDQVGNYSFGAAQFLLPRIIGTFAPARRPGHGLVFDRQTHPAHHRLRRPGDSRTRQVTSGGAGAHTLESWLRRAKDAGIEFVSISPLKSDAPDFLGAQWIPIRPNTDTAMMLAMAHTLLSEKRHDASFVERYCTGFEAFRRYLLGLDDSMPKDAQWAEAITGVAADTIRELARRAAATRSMITCAWSLQRAHHGEQPYWAASCWRRCWAASACPAAALRSATARPMASARRVSMWRGLRSRCRSIRRAPSIPVARIADMLLHPGESYEFNGRRDNYPDIQLVYWAGGNPFHHHQDLNRLQRAWQKPETVIVHESWWTPTARHADIVLPATTTLERNDVGGSSRDPFILAMHRAIDPVGDARNDFDIFRALARRLGYETSFTERPRRDGLVPMGLRPGARRARRPKASPFPASSNSGPKASSRLPPPERDYVLFEDFRRDPERHPLKTPSGRIEIVSDDVRRLRLRRTARRIRPGCRRRSGCGSASAQRWPIHLVTHQPASRLHSQMDPGSVSRGQKVNGREPIRINPPDATRRGIRDGDIVRVFNARGACLAGAVVDPDVMPGVVVMATGAWFDPSDTAGAPERHGNPNVLTLDIGTSPLAQGTSALTALVEIERWDAPAPAVRAFAPPQFAAAG